MRGNNHEAHKGHKDMTEDDLIKPFKDVPTTHLFRTLHARVQLDFVLLKNLLKLEPLSTNLDNFSESQIGEKYELEYS